MAYGKQAYDKQNILLESGTNEVEIAEFQIGSQSFGVNVAKIREFLPYDRESVTKLPNTHPSLLGVFLLRGRTIPLIDLSKHLEMKKTSHSDRPVVLVTEFNKMVNGFVIDSINRIHRLSWNNIEPLNPILSKHSPRVTGTVNVNNADILILDLEQVIGEIFPGKMESLTKHTEKQETEKTDIAKDRAEKKLIIAEDSTMIRTLIKNAVSASGYNIVAAFENGKDAYEHMVKLKKQSQDEKKNITAYVDIVITDIEMPQMDGLTLCKKIKQELNFTNIPVIVFSSLINEQMAKKCEGVGADAYTSKPQIPELVSIMDNALNIKRGIKH